MTEYDDEETQIRSVALQNSQSIVHARRDAEEALRNQSEWLRVTLASIGDAVISTDKDARVTFMNRVAESLTRWPEAEAMGRPLPDVFQIINEQSRLPVESPVDRVLREGITVGLANHTILVAKDGTERPIDDSAAPIRDSDNRIVGAVLIFRDDTVRRHAVASLERSERELRVVTDHAPALLAHCDRESRFKFVNKTYADHFGLQPEDVVGKGIRDVLGGTVHAALEGCIAEVLAGHPVEFEVEVPGRGGSSGTNVMRCAYTPERDGDNVVGFVAAMIDITERKRADERVVYQKRLLEALTESVVDGIMIVSPDGRMIHQNQRFADIWKFPAAVLAAQSDTAALEWAAEQTADPAAFLARVKFIYDRPDEEFREELALNNGRVYERCGAPIRDGDARLGWVWTFRDVTERKRGEESLREADHRKDEFLATLAHELRNPLAPLKNSLELIKRASSNTELVEQASATMERQIGQMVRLIDDLLDVSRITSSKLKLQTQRVELAVVVHAAVEACGADYERLGHQLNVTLPAKPIYLNADPVRLTQVLGNLLTNSAKYTEPGGRVWLAVELVGSDVAVRVKDTGVGIPPAMLSSVFEMFSQVDATLDRSEGGLGIGLSLVQRLVAMHGGTVTAHSEGRGRGSEFIVRLPVLVEKLDAPTFTEPDRDPRSPPARRILIVDDNRDSAHSLDMLLRLTGNETTMAHDGVEAVDKAVAFRPDVIVLDIGLPRMNGYEACRAIREQPWGKDIVMVALTGWGQDDDRRRALEAGFDHHMIKPVNFGALQDVLAGNTPNLAGRTAVRSD